ncbi:hypothetical protein LTS18_006665 [Coniosporium uncinatum]|uniref:Uncharacterized protein n=1 Tax=Coniosporium uncinatum TaxID=93489 RepID=A0ACC3DQ90_9PEZI|nr:hypothetical protein LTS18_006665 [Coniosporium uncinatum]
MQNHRRNKKWDSGLGPGGPISQSAIAPKRNRDHADVPTPHQTDSDTLAPDSGEQSPESSMEKGKSGVDEPEEEIYQEGSKTVIEDEEGNVLDVVDTQGESPEEEKRHVKRRARQGMVDRDVEHGVSQKDDPDSSHQEDAGQAMMDEIKEDFEHPQRQWRKKMGQFAALKRKDDAKVQEREQKKRGPALAYQFGNTIIVEDEDGEVLKKYDIPQQPKRPGMSDRKTSVVGEGKTRERIHRMGTYMGLNFDRDEKDDEAGPSSSGAGGERRKTMPFDDPDDDNIRFTVTAGGQRMSKAEFIKQIQRMDPKSRAEMVEDSDVPEVVKKEAREDAKDDAKVQRQSQQQQQPPPAKRGRTVDRIPEPVSEESAPASAPLNLEGADAALRKVGSKDDAPAGPDGIALVDSNNEEVPFHSFFDDFSMRQQGGAGAGNKETAAQRRRRLADPREAAAGGGDGGGSPPAPAPALASTAEINRPSSKLEEGETAAERRRREGALGLTQEENSDSEEDEGPMGVPSRRVEQKARETEAEGSGGGSRPTSTPGIRFADQVRPPPQGGGSGSGSGQGSRGLRWGADVGRKR